MYFFAFFNSLKVFPETSFVIKTRGMPFLILASILGVKCLSLKPKPTTRKLKALLIRASDFCINSLYGTSYVSSNLFLLGTTI
jgi:hypothetical protein